MGIFKRLSDIITANMSDMLERAEDPEKMIGQVVGEMEEAVAVARRNTAQAIAEQKRLDKELGTNRRLRDEWRRKACESLQQDQESQARRALMRKNEHQSVIDSLDQQDEAVRVSCEALKRTLKALEAKLADARRRKRILATRKKIAEAQAAAQDGLARGRATTGARSPERFDRLEEQVTEMEAQADALREMGEADQTVADELDGMQAQDDIDREIEQIRRELGKPQD